MPTMRQLIGLINGNHYLGWQWTKSIPHSYEECYVNWKVSMQNAITQKLESFCS